MSSRTLTVLTTVDSLTQARRIARALVTRGLAACVHIAPIESFYRWNGRLQHEREFQLTLTTTAARSAALQSALRSLHPYELPAIAVLRPAAVHAPYARWVQQSCIRPTTSTLRSHAKRGTAA